MTKNITINQMQADIIFKALHYVARSEGISIPSEYTQLYEFLAEENPNKTYNTLLTKEIILC